MLRRAFLQTSRFASVRPAVRAAPILRLTTPIKSSVSQSWKFQAVRCYAASAGLSKEEITGRILELLKNFDKVTDASKLTEKSHFNNDLGLDSLDTVEVVMAIEEEFGIEMPDKDADAIQSVDQAIAYIQSQPDGKQ